MKKIVVATRNRGKILEIADLLSKFNVSIITLDDLSCDIKVEEDADTFEGNAIKKAVTICEAVQLPVLSDDSGLEVDALNGRPGVHSARYGGENLSDKQKYELLLKELGGIPQSKRSARFKCVTAFAYPQNLPTTVDIATTVSPVSVTFSGEVNGHISKTPDGESGFGYDPVFVPLGYDKTMAQLGSQIKSKISHRAVALVKFQKWFIQNFTDIEK